MVQLPYAYDKNPHPPAGRLRLWIGIVLLLTTLAAALYLLWALQPRPPADDSALPPAALHDPVIR